MWQSAHHHVRNHGGNDCFDPGRDRCDDWDRDRGHGHGHERHHGGGNGWGDPGCHDGGNWGDPGCHDGGHGLINFDHNSFLACH